MDVVVRKRTLERLGLARYGAVHENLPPARLYEMAVHEEGAKIVASGALATSSGAKTGRSPKDKRIVDNAWITVRRITETEAKETVGIEPNAK